VGWRATLTEKHLASCDFILLSCPNESHNRFKVVQLLRKYMEKHTKEGYPRRQYECSHYQEVGEYREMTTEHLRKYPMVEIPCPSRRFTSQSIAKSECLKRFLVNILLLVVKRRLNVKLNVHCLFIIMF
jgi:hypothetical protein